MMRTLLALLAVTIPTVATAQIRTRSLRLAYPSNASLPSGLVRWQPGIQGPDDFFQMQPGDGVSQPWNVGVVSQPNGGGETRNNVVRIEGWNCGTQGLISSTNGKSCMHHEQFFNAGGSTRLMETYWTAQAKSIAPEYRWLGVNLRLDSLYTIQVWMRGDEISMGPGLTVADSPTFLLTTTNGQLRSPNFTKGFYVDDNQVNLFTSGAKNLYLFNTDVRMNVPVAPTDTDTYDVGVDDGNPALRRWWRYGLFTRGVKFRGPLGNRPACSAQEEGLLYIVQSGAGARTRLYWCAASDAGAFNWLEIANGGA